MPFHRLKINFKGVEPHVKDKYPRSSDIFSHRPTPHANEERTRSDASCRENEPSRPTASEKATEIAHRHPSRQSADLWPASRPASRTEPAL